ncbi:TIR domain-containing protein [Flammeovirga yaeyamensis]|uniref:TIR domain-containing protein n=1 Tax=Flammeovirga yaeyamensis TaxID=367791 RepID=A0AAX1N7E3_9BACT|nr:toll/interleukin-1 receptor domain-containing protein [Flammeovirga yaeyamensis]MBB3697729.1 hypothetical protein [Flammeovirga yaeyamensis]NMF35913.1 toll/interleukin-1 receptor domain-containing protein [Flammeovirga yaeyamensis]QWG03137.1 TIR domain-containing protein [Flammeovirga yaeyamensis]
MKAKIFYSYSHKDEDFREKLENHLVVLRKSGFIEEWHDRRIAPGSNWEEEINENINDSNIILLLVSSNFLASDYCYDTETIRALERHNSKEAIVIPIIIQPCLWKVSHFADAKLQALPKDGKAITTWENEEEAWLEVAEGILKISEKFKEENTLTTQTKSDEINTRNENKIKEKLVESFLCKYSTWYFSPLRIVKWGGKQAGFETLSQYTSSEISEVLKDFVDRGLALTKKSQKGNTIYKLR